MAAGRADDFHPLLPCSPSFYGADWGYGRGKIMSRARLGRRGLEVLRGELSGRDVAITKQVAELKLMSARQIEAVHFPHAQHASAITAARSCRRVLERLTRERLLLRLSRRVGGIRAGSASYIYALGPVGQRVIGEEREVRRRFREPSSTFAVHTLAVAQLVVDVTSQARRGTFDIIGLQTEPTCWRMVPGGLAVASVLRPDLYVALGVDDFEHRWFVEIDLGTEHLPTLLRKCVTYEAYYRSGREQAEHGVFPRVLWLMQKADRVERLRDAIEADGRLTDGLFVVMTRDTAVAALAGGES